jgi:hypothetical protein
MAQLQPTQDLFGLGRLAQQIRLNRQEERQNRLDQQNAQTTGLQQENLRLGIQQKQMGLAGLQRQQQIRQGLIQAVQGAEEGQQDLAAFEYLKQNDPLQAREFADKAFERAKQIVAIGGAQAAVDSLKNTIGVDIKLLEEDAGSYTIDLNDRIQRRSKKDHSVIFEEKKGVAQKALTPQQKAFESLTPEEQKQTFIKGQRITRVNPQTGEVEIIEGAAPAQTKGRTAVDKDFAKDFSKIMTGGLADPLKQIDQLKGAIESLESGRNITGPVVGFTPDAILTIFNPEAIEVREKVEEVVQRNLREILGAQFTEKEGERLIARAFNPKLEEAVNIKRVKNLLRQMEIAVGQKRDAAEYFRQNGTLTGFTGKLPVLSDFQDLDSDRSGLNIEQNVILKAHPVFGDVTESDIQTTMENNNLTREEVLQKLKELR